MNNDVLLSAAVVLTLGATICGCSGSLPDRAQSWKLEYDTGMKHAAAGQFDMAEANFRAALKLSENFTDNNPQTALTLLQLGQTLGKEGKIDDSRTFLERALASFEAMYKPDVSSSTNSEFGHNLSVSALALGNQARDSMLLDKSARYYSRALDVAQAVNAPSSETEEILKQRTRMLKMVGANAETKVLTGKRPVTSAENATWQDLKDSADFAVKGGNYANAVDLYKSAIRAAEIEGGVRHIAVCEIGLAQCLELSGQSDAALVEVKAALAKLKRRRDESKEEVSLLGVAGRIYSHKRMFVDAENSFRSALAINRQYLDTKRGEDRARELASGLTTALIESGKLKEAEKFARERLHHHLNGSHPDSQNVADDQLLLAEILAKQKRNEEARDLYMRTLSLEQGKAGVDPRSALLAMDSFSKFLRSIGDTKAAELQEANAEKLRAEFH